MNKIILAENQDTAIGFLWFIPNVTFVKGKPCKGWGKERYPEGSTYEGEVEYDGKNFYRQGYGVQDFSTSNLPFDGLLDSKVSKFVGLYDRHSSPWMYGNGIFYLVDEVTGEPKHFIKGFFYCTTKLDEWHGDFDPSMLANGYTMDMETNFIPFLRRVNNLKQKWQGKDSCDYLFMGDSWVEQWQDKARFSFCTYYNDTEGLDAVNVGVGGSKYSDWLKWIDELVISHNPKKIFINLGFNDLHHGEILLDVYDNFVNVVTTLKKALPNVRIYINSVTHCSPFVKFFKEEVRLNKMIEEYCNNSDYLVYIDVNKLFTKRGKMIKNMDDYCIDDNLHLNEKGYKIWAPYVMDFVKNK